VFMFAVLFVACSQLDIEPNQPGDNLRVLALEASNGGPIGVLLTAGEDYTSGPGGNVSCDDITVKDEEGNSIVFESSTGRINEDDPEFYQKFEEKGFKITVTDGKYVSWEYIGELCLSEVAVIVKGGAGANVYYYTGADILGDNGLTSPNNASGNPADLSNLTICYTEVPCDDKCYEFKDETAWSAGSRYNTRGNWATYTAYNGVAKTVKLFAGQTLEAGSVSFSAPVDGEVEITITLNEDWFFDDVLENVKIQDYATAPSGNPSPGGFAHKDTATESPFSITVPANNFYGVHVDVTKRTEVECVIEEVEE
jgi:hypothetical protein